MSNFHIKRAKLDGYRNIRGTEAVFCDGLNIIIGPNGCGKSNFLWFLSIATYGDLNEEYHAEMTYELSDFSKDVNVIQQNIENIRNPDRGRNAFITHSDFYINGVLIKDTLLNKAIHYIDGTYRILLLNYNIPFKIECFSEPEDISAVFTGRNQYLDSKNIILNNIFTAYHFNKAHDSSRTAFIFDSNFIDFSDTLKKQVAEYTPVKDIRVKNRIIDINEDYAKTIKYHSLLYEFQTEDGRYYTWNELSDGTRRIVWLILNILTTNRDVILIEEPELGIHPHQLARLMDFIKEQSAHKQFIITTHSPEVLDILDENELDRIKIARYDAERKTTLIEPLSERKIASIQKYFKEEGLLSSYWSNIGLESKPKR